MMFYISGALHGSASLDDARYLYETTAKLVEKKGASYFLPHKQTDPVRAAHVSSDDVFARDLQAIKTCSAVIAFLNEASHGVGAEVAMCLEWQKPILPLLEESRSCSRFLEGLIRSHGIEVIRYQNTNDISNVLDRFISANERQGMGQNRPRALLHRA